MIDPDALSATRVAHVVQIFKDLLMAPSIPIPLQHRHPHPFPAQPPANGLDLPVRRPTAPLPALRRQSPLLGVPYDAVTHALETPIVQRHAPVILLHTPSVPLPERTRSGPGGTEHVALAIAVDGEVTVHVFGVDARPRLRVVGLTAAMHDEGGVLVVVVVFPLEEGALVEGGRLQMVRLGAVAVCRCQPVAGRWCGHVSDVAIYFVVLGYCHRCDC